MFSLLIYLLKILDTRYSKRREYIQYLDISTIRSAFNINKNHTVKLYFNMHHFQFTCDINDQNLLRDKIDITGRSRNEKLLVEYMRLHAWSGSIKEISILYIYRCRQNKKRCKIQKRMGHEGTRPRATLAGKVSTIAVSSLYPSIPSAIPGQDIQISLRLIGSRPYHFGRIPMYWNSL